MGTSEGINFRGQIFLAFVAASGFCANTLVYFYSFFGIIPDTISGWEIFLSILGAIGLFVPMFILEYPASRKDTFFIKGFAMGMPNWVAFCSKLLAVVAVSHFLWFAAHSGSRVPEIRDGEYILNSKGQILRVLQEGEYFALVRAKTRMAATMMAFFYFISMTYYWFSRRPQGAK